jgi:hypothetical protein
MVGRAQTSPDQPWSKALKQGYALITLCLVTLVLGSFALLFSAFFPLTGVTVSPIPLNSRAHPTLSADARA